MRILIEVFNYIAKGVLASTSEPAVIETNQRKAELEAKNTAPEEYPQKAIVVH